MKSLVLFAGLLFLADPYSCNDTSSQTAQPTTSQAATPAPASQFCPADHRFQKVEVYPISLRSDLALDSCTGQLCRTWDWHAVTKNSIWSTYEDLPTCASLPNTRP